MKRALFWSILLTTLLKTYFAYLAPITGDEAEYIFWSEHISWGYYHHPPLIGWLLYPFSAISTDTLFIRLPQLFTTSVVGWVIYRLLDTYPSEKQQGITMLYLWSPVHLFNITILTDTPLMLFCALAVYALVQAERRQKLIYYVGCGFSLGLAYLSKYLMLPVFLSVMAYVCLDRQVTQRMRKCAIILLCMSPMVLQNVLWNAAHDWVNFGFNLAYRNTEEDTGFVWYKPLFYVALLVYTVGPMVVIYLKRWRELRVLVAPAPDRFFLYVLLIPTLFWGALSTVKWVGLHWAFSSYLAFFLPLGVIKTRRWWRHCRAMMWYSGIQALVIIILFHLPMHFWSRASFYQTINWFLNYDQVFKEIKPYTDKGYVLCARSYAQAYLLSYRHHVPVCVWGPSSVNSRQDDFSTDYKTLAGKSFVILDIDHDKSLTEFLHFFRHVDVKEFQLNERPYYLILGKGFDYEHYRQIFLYFVYHNFYQGGVFPKTSHYYGDKYGIR